MKELDQLVENFFQPKRDTLGLDQLVEMVEEVMSEQSLEEMAALTGAELNKRENAKQLAKAIESGVELELTPWAKEKYGVETVVANIKRPETIATLQFLNNPPIPLGTTLKIATVDNPPKFISTGNLQKTGDFGGKGSEFYVSKELAAIKQLEDAIEMALELAKQDGFDDINIIVKDDGEELRRFNDVKTVYRSPAKSPEPKTDFTLQNKNGKDIAFISHKHGERPQDFGQWSGVSAKAGEAIKDHPEITQFYTDLRQVLETDAKGNYYYPAGISFSRKIQDEKLKMMAIFGPEYTNDLKPGGPNNSDIVVQGTFILTQDENKKDDFILTANHLMVRGKSKPKPSIESQPELEMPAAIDDDGDGYTPMIKTRYSGDRSNLIPIGKDDEGETVYARVKGMRATIYPAKGRLSVDLDDYIRLQAKNKEDYFEKKEKEKEQEEENP